MLRTDRPLPGMPMLAAELRDALGRRQKELPARWLVGSDVRAGPKSDQPTAESADLREAALALAALDRCPGSFCPRGVVCVHASTSGATRVVVDALRERGTTTSIAAIEGDPDLARQAALSLASRQHGHLVMAVSADCTLSLPLPNDFPTTRLYLCLGNALGAVTAVGAVRMLRVLRSTMTPGDAIVLGVTTTAGRVPTTSVPAELAVRHLGALTRINGTFGSSLDPTRFECESRYDAENRRAETHLVARRALTARIPGVCDVRLNQGESIRTAVSCTFDRTRLAAMLGGVGLSLRTWEDADAERIAVAVASPAT